MCVLPKECIRNTDLPRAEHARRTRSHPCRTLLPLRSPAPCPGERMKGRKCGARARGREPAREPAARGCVRRARTRESGGASARARARVPPAPDVPQQENKGHQRYLSSRRDPGLRSAPPPSTAQCPWQCRSHGARTRCSCGRALSVRGLLIPLHFSEPVEARRQYRAGSPWGRRARARSSALRAALPCTGGRTSCRAAPARSVRRKVSVPSLLAPALPSAHTRCPRRPPACASRWARPVPVCNGAC